jgi:hypothetical protein
MMIIEIRHDRNGLVSIPLSNSERMVTMSEDDYNMLINLEVTFPWLLRQDAIYFKSGTSYINIGRLILDCSPGFKTSFIDADPCNMRRDNMLLLKGSSKTSARSEINKTAIQSKRQKIEVRHLYLKEAS